MILWMTEDDAVYISRGIKRRKFRLMELPLVTRESSFAG